MYTVAEFIERYPAPPPIGRGERRHVVSVALNDNEYEAIQRLAHHPDARMVYDGSLTAVVRHALNAYLWGLGEVGEDDFKNIGDRLRDEIETANLMQSEKQIIELLDSKARRFNLLLNHDQLHGALDEYDKLLNFIEQLGYAWAPVVYKYMSSHSDMQHFRTRVRRLGVEEETMLKNVEERPR